MPEQPARRQQMEEVVTPSPVLSCCPKHPAAAAAPCMLAPPPAVSSGCLTTLWAQYCLRQTFFFHFFQLSHNLCVFAASCHSVVIWQLPAYFSYQPKKNIIRKGESVAKSIA